MDDPMANMDAKAMTCKILWASLAFSQLTYLLILYLQTRQTPPDWQPPEQMAVIQWTLAAVSAGIPAVIVLLRKMLYFDPAERDAIEPQQAWGKLYTMYLITWALAEAIAINGFVVGFLSRDLVNYLPFLSGGLLLMFLFPPRPERHLKKIRDLGVHRGHW